MIAFAIAAVLITQMGDGSLKVVEGLSDHACEEARCVAVHGMTCAEKKDKDLALTAALARVVCGSAPLPLHLIDQTTVIAAHCAK